MKKNYTFQLDIEIMDKVKEQAEKQDRSINWTVNQILKNSITTK
jgi:predicted transcriptional regulator